MEIAIEYENNHELPIVIAFKRIIEQAGEVGAERGLASPAFNQRFHVLPWHRNKND